MWITLAGLVAVVVAMAAAWVIVEARSLKSGDETAAASATDRQLSGDRGDWSAAVCQDGSVTPPLSANFRFPDAKTVSYCSAKAVSPGSAPSSIMIAQWPASVAVGEELSKSPEFRQFAAGPSSGETVVFAPVASADQSLLEPLTAFGFTIVSLP